MEGFCGLNLTGLACWIGDDESTQIHELCLAVQGCSAPILRPEGSGAEAARGASLLRSARIRQREPKSGVFVCRHSAALALAATACGPLAPVASNRLPLHRQREQLQASSRGSRVVVFRIARV